MFHYETIRCMGFDPLLEALEHHLGACLIADEDGHVRSVTEGARALLGDALLSLHGLGVHVPRESGALRLRSSHTGLELDCHLQALPSGWLLRIVGPAETARVNYYGMVSGHASMRELFRVIERVAKQQVTVLIRGETGSGKELVAEALHRLSPRKKGPFRPLNCAAIPPSLLESQLFGHTKGAFTGAIRDAAGHFALADGGTIFLDEVAEIPLDVQAKLLRVLETRSVLPVGARDAINVDVRIVSATHKSLRREVEAGRFRADLMYRLRVFPLYLPPLREREGDIEMLAMHFVEQQNRTSKRQIGSIHPEALRILASYKFPGNVRELQNVIQYAFAIGDTRELLPADLPVEVREDHRESLAPPPLRQAEMLAALGARGGFSFAPPAARGLASSTASGSLPAPMTPYTRSSVHPPPRTTSSPPGHSPLVPPLPGTPALPKGYLRGSDASPASESAPTEAHIRPALSKEIIRHALVEADGERARAAAALGVSRVTLWRRMKALGLGRQRRPVSS
jgi:transcriptional regulator with GAF, ATPase, and Fis domain